MTLDLPGTYVAGADHYYKWDAVNGWQTFPYTNGATMNQVVLALTDGGAGDADGVANGQIVDPGGPGMGLGMFGTMPDVVGMTQADAETAIQAAGLVVGTVTTANSDTVANGDVISQSPAAGTTIGLGSAVDIEVSLGPAAGGGGTVGGSNDSNNGFGCSVGSGDGPVDPTLPFLVLIAMLYLTRRGWMRIRRF
jgi:hypothetical protein